MKKALNAILIFPFFLQTQHSLEIQGHRGYRGGMPENTLAGFIKALEIGVHTLEMDLVISKDHEVVVTYEPCFSQHISTRPKGEVITKKTEKQHNLYPPARVKLNDMTKPISFFEKLGPKLIVKSLPHYARFECPNGNSSFSIHQKEELPKGDGIYVYFECENLDEQVENIKSKGIEFDQEPTDQRCLWREARLKDVDGNQLILFHGGENRLYPPWRIEN